jgi:hypothetical protein
MCVESVNKRTRYNVWLEDGMGSADTFLFLFFVWSQNALYNTIVV